MRKSYRLLGNHQLVPVLIFSLLAHSVFSPVVEASLFDGFYWGRESNAAVSDFKPYGLTVDASFSDEALATAWSCSTGCELSDDEDIKPEDKQDENFQSCMAEKLQDLQLSHCPGNSEETQALFDGFFANTTGGDCLHLQDLDQDTKSVIFLVLLLSNGCNNTAYTVARNVTDELDNNAEDGFPQGHGFDGESAVRNLLLHFNNTKLLFEFEVLVSASQVAQHYDQGGLEKINQWLNELDLSFEEREEFIPRIISHAHVHRRISRSSCVDRTEQDIYNVVQYIPLIGQLWGIGSAIGYAATKCNDAAKERGIDVAIGAALDLATVATLGTGAAGFQGLKIGIKAGIKYGVRAGLKAGFKASGTVFKRVAIQSLKESKQWLKNPIKALARDAKNVFNAVKNIPKTVRNIPKALKNTAKGFKNYIDELAELRKTRKAIQKELKGANLHKNKWKYEVYTPKAKQEVTFNKKLNRATERATVEYHTTNPYILDSKALQKFKLQSKGYAKNKFVYTKAELESDHLWKSLKHDNELYESPGSHGLSVGSCRMKRTPVGKRRKLCHLPEEVEEKLKDILIRRAERGTEYREINQKYLVPKLTDADVSVSIKKGRGFQQQTFSGTDGAKKIDLVNTNIGKVSTNDIENKYVFSSLQHYYDMAPSYSFSKAGDKLVTRAPIEVEMVIGGEPRKFVLTDSKMYLGEKVEGQIFIGTSDENFHGIGKTQTSSDYDSLVDELGGTDGLGNERAKEILSAIEEKPVTQAGHVWKDMQVSGKKVFSKQQERAAVELIAITQIAENALPDEKLINAMVQKKIPPSKWGPRSGRVPGSDKWARSVLGKIKDGEITWHEAFNRQDGIYTLSRRGGTEKSRRIFAGRKHLEDASTDIRTQTLDEISESSGSDHDGFFSRVD